MDASAVFLIGGTCLAQQSDEKGFLEFIAARKLRRGTAKLALSKTANEEVSSLAGGIVAVYEGVASNLRLPSARQGASARKSPVGHLTQRSRASNQS